MLKHILNFYKNNVEVSNTVNCNNGGELLSEFTPLKPELEEITKNQKSGLKKIIDE